MNLRSSAWLPLSLLSTILWTSAHARGETGEEDALAALEQRQAPLTLSADGHWRLYVDANNVLHRVNLAQPTQVGGSIKMVQGVRMLSASRSGQKVAFTTAAGCIGLVDFGSAPNSTPRTTWQPIVGEYAGQPAVAAPAAWLDVPPVACTQSSGAQPAGHLTVALASSGRLLATRDQVIDTETHQVVATLPPSLEDIGQRYVLRLRFVDRDTKLLVLSATFGEGYESLGSPSDLRMAVWDLASRSLDNLASHEDALLQGPQSLFSDFSAQTNVLTWVDTARFKKSPMLVAPGKREPPLDAVQSRLGSCSAGPVVRFPIFAYDWTEMVVDPWGRWVAGMQRVDAQSAEDAKAGGFVEQLVVMDIGSRRVVSTARFPHELHGLVATPDGGTIYALAAPDSALPAGAKAEHLPADVPELKVDLAKVTTPRMAAETWDAAPCRLDGEAPGARDVSRQERVLQAAWSRPYESAADDGSHNTVPFVMRDGTVWLDLGATIAQVDPATGHTLRTLPTPRSAKVASVPVAMADGFVNTQGDTLSWRPFDTTAPGAPARRVMDVRKGWTVVGVKPLARSVLAVWQANEGTPVRKPTEYTSESVVVALYDAVSGRRLHDYAEDGQTYGEVGDESQSHWLPSLLPHCEDEQGPLTSGIDWRIGPFDSLRATDCAGTPADARTVAWFGLDIAPRTAAVAPPDGDPSRSLTIDGGIATARDGYTIRVFDIAARREIGRIVLAPTDTVTWVNVLAAHGLVLVDASSSAPGAEGRTLRVYSFR